jgi:signal transduction histidine kinase
MNVELAGTERDSAAAPASQVGEAGRARFEAVRRRVFDEMQRGYSRRWKLAMVVPFQVLVLALLVAGGATKLRIGVQLATYLVWLGTAAFADSVHGRRNFLALTVSAFALLGSVANTGGLGSPLLISTVPFLLATSMNPNLACKRVVFFAVFLLGFGALAFLSHGEPGLLGAPVHWATPEYTTIALASSALTVVAIYKIGRGMTSAYERIALELAERREDLCDEAEGRTRALEGIAARLAHEVKNPLAAIKGLSTHVARQAEDPKVKERLSIVAGEAERLQDIVEGFLSFSRGLDELSIAPTKPYDIAHELSLLLETRAADAGIGIEVRGSRELTLNADNKKLRQALLNLVLNAMQASPRGSTVTLEVAKSCIDGAAVVKVMDRGAGMTPEILDRIRKPYYTTKEGGSGLGIAVARGIIEQHGGTLRFESTSGRGTTATVTLPPCAKAAQMGRTKLPDCRAYKAVQTALADADAPRHPTDADKVPS